MPEHCNTEKKDINPEAVDIGDYNRDGSSFATVTPPIICVSSVNWTVDPITYNLELEAIEGTAFIRGKNLNALECAFLAESQPLKTLIFPEDGDIYIESLGDDNAWRAFIAIDNKFEYINETDNESNWWWVEVDKDYAEKCGHILLEHSEPYAVTWDNVNKEYSQPGQLKDPELGFPKFKTLSFVEYNQASEGISEPDTLNVTNYDLVYDSRGHIVGFKGESSSSYTINTGGGGDLNVTSIDCSGTQVSEGEDIIHLEFAGGLDVTFPVDENKAIINLDITNADPWLNVDCDGNGLTIAHEDAGPAGEQTTTKTLVLYQEETVETPAAFYDATLTYDAKGHVINVETGTPLDLTGGTTGVEVNRSLCTTGVSDTYTATTISFGSEFSVFEETDVNGPTGTVLIELPITVNTDPHEWIEIEECTEDEPGYILNHGDPHEGSAQESRDIFAVTGADFNAATNILSFTNTDYKFDAKGHRLTTDVSSSGFSVNLGSLVDTFDICAELNCPPNDNITYVLTINNNQFNWVQVGPFECDDGTDEPSLIVYIPDDRWISIDANAKTIGHADADSANVASNPDFISDLTSFSLTDDTLELNFTRHDITFDGKGHYVSKDNSTTTSISISLSSFNNEVNTYTATEHWIDIVETPEGDDIVHADPSTTVFEGYKPAVTNLSGDFATASNTVAITLTYNQFGFDEKGHFMGLDSVATATASAVITFPPPPPPNDYTATDHWITLTNLDFTHNVPSTANTTSKAILSSLDDPIAVNEETNVVTFTFQSNTVERDEKGHILAFSDDTSVDRTINFTELLNTAMQTVKGGDHISVTPDGKEYTVNHDGPGTWTSSAVSVSNLTANYASNQVTISLTPAEHRFDSKGHYTATVSGSSTSTSFSLILPEPGEPLTYTGEGPWINVDGTLIKHEGPGTLAGTREPSITAIETSFDDTSNTVSISLTYNEFGFDEKGHFVDLGTNTASNTAVITFPDPVTYTASEHWIDIVETPEGDDIVHADPSTASGGYKPAVTSFSGNFETASNTVAITLTYNEFGFDAKGHFVELDSVATATASAVITFPDPPEYSGSDWITVNNYVVSHDDAGSAQANLNAVTAFTGTYAEASKEIQLSLTRRQYSFDAKGHYTATETSIVSTNVNVAGIVDKFDGKMSTDFTGDDTWIEVDQVNEKINHIGPDETTQQPFIENITGINVNTATLSAVTIELTYQKYKFDTKGHYVLTTAESITSDAINLESEQINVVGGNYLTATKEGNTVTIDHDIPNEINPTIAISTISSTGNSIGLTVNGEIQVTLVPMNIYFDGWGHRVSAASGTQITLTSEDLNIPDPIEYGGDGTWITISETTISHETAHSTNLSRTYVSGGGDINVNTGIVSLTTQSVAIDTAGHVTESVSGSNIAINILPSTDALTGAHALVWDGGQYKWEPIEEFECDEPPSPPEYTGEPPWITIDGETITHGTSSTADPGKNITVLDEINVDRPNASITVYTKDLQIDEKNHVIGESSTSSATFNLLPELPDTPTEGQRYTLTAVVGSGSSITYEWVLVGEFDCPSE